MSGRRAVSVVVPAYNEAAHIERCLEALSIQSVGDDCEVIVVDGGSSDGTKRLAARFPGVIVLDNPRRAQAAALNIGLAAARGDLFVRMDAHAVPTPDYVERIIDTLDRTGAALVGGVMEPQATSAFGAAVAYAMRSVAGAGGARFHRGGPSGWADTVYLGAARTELLRQVGGFDETVGVNEDGELAHRMRRVGGVWLETSIITAYIPREAMVPLGRQYFRYGRSRVRTVLKHRSVAPRQLPAPLLVLGLASRHRVFVTVAYLAGVAAVVARATELPRDARAALAVVLPTMHLAWGAGCWAELALSVSALARRRGP